LCLCAFAPSLFSYGRFEDVLLGRDFLAEHGLMLILTRKAKSSPFLLSAALHAYGTSFFSRSAFSSFVSVSFA
jgi:hypothetical protein